MTKAPHPPADLVADVAIVGGGMVGMTLAAALGSAGLAVAVVDAEAPAAMTAAAFDGRSSAIAFGSRQVLAGIGAWAAMAAEAQPILDIRVSDGRATGGASRLFLHYDHRDLATAGGDRTDAPPFGFIVENRVIRRALLRRLAELPGVVHAAPARVASVDRRTAAAVLHLDDGRSVSARGVAHEHFLPAGPFAMLPMVDDDGIHRSSIVWTERRELAPAMMALDAAAFAAEIERRFGPSLGRLHRRRLTAAGARVLPRPRA